MKQPVVENSLVSLPSFRGRNPGDLVLTERQASTSFYRFIVSWFQNPADDTSEIEAFCKIFAINYCKGTGLPVRVFEETDTL